MSNWPVLSALLILTMIGLSVGIPNGTILALLAVPVAAEALAHTYEKAAPRVIEATQRLAKMPRQVFERLWTWIRQRC